MGWGGEIEFDKLTILKLTQEIMIVYIKKCEEEEEYEKCAALLDSVKKIQIDIDILEHELHPNLNIEY